MTTISEKLLDQMVQTIVDEVSPEQIILFGSWAKGTANQESDVDFLIIASEGFGESRSRKKVMAGLWKALARFAVSKDILVYSREEVQRWQTSLNHVVGRALREGRVLYERH